MTDEPPPLPAEFLQFGPPPAPTPSEQAKINNPPPSPRPRPRRRITEQIVELPEVDDFPL